jgi:putative tryptophan/tyrosine transport system substrate-binding protein
MRLIGLAVALALMLSPLATAGQPAGKVPRIGYLLIGSPDDSAEARRIGDAFRQGLRERGYVADQSIVIEYRSADGKVDRLGALAAEFVRLKVDCIVAAGTQATQAAKQATGAIPIVMAAASDPVGAGLITSLARPGGNVTGSTLLAPELSGKRLELLKEAIPRLSCTRRGRRDAG